MVARQRPEIKKRNINFISHRSPKRAKGERMKPLFTISIISFPFVLRFGSCGIVFYFNFGCHDDEYRCRLCASFWKQRHKKKKNETSRGMRESSER
jgi:hypothetical protein